MQQHCVITFLLLFVSCFSFGQEFRIDTVFISNGKNVTNTDTIPPTKVPHWSDYPWHHFLNNDSLSEHYRVLDNEKYTFSQIQSDLLYFIKTYPEFVKRVWVGQSEFGIDMTAIRIGKGEAKENRVLLVGNIHAREDFSSKLLMKFVNIYLLSIDGKSNLYPRAKELLDSLDIFVIPVANPDGLKIAHMDFEGIEADLVDELPNIKVLETLEEWKANGKGIDLNKSFDDGNFHLKRGNDFQSKQASEGYKGQYPSQPEETQRIQELVMAIKPIATASFHTKGNILFWADKFTHPMYNGIDTEINQRIADVSGYRMASVASDPTDFSSGLENFVRSRLGAIGTCIELSSGGGSRKQLPDDLFNENVWHYAWNIPYVFITSALEFAPQLKEISRNYLNPVQVRQIEE